MRTLKFRAWSPKHESMAYSDEHKDAHGLASFFDALYQHDVFMPDQFRHILMQFTGLKDKNGKEIYDGDFVEIEEGPNKSKREVVWHKSTACFALAIGNGATEYLPNYVRYRQIEVIGNIYSNPDLLK